MIDVNGIAAKVGGQVVAGQVIATVNGKAEYIVQRASGGSGVFITPLGEAVLASKARMEQVEKLAAELQDDAAPKGDPVPQVDPAAPAPQADAATLNALEAALASSPQA